MMQGFIGSTNVQLFYLNYLALSHVLLLDVIDEWLFFCLYWVFTVIVQPQKEKLQRDVMEAFQYLKELYDAILPENLHLKSVTVCFFKHFSIQTKPKSFPFHQESVEYFQNFVSEKLKTSNSYY